jgi:elongation factor G
MHQPLLSIVIALKSDEDSRKLTIALATLMAEDPAISSIPHAGSAVVLGVSDERQLATIVHRLAREFQVAAHLSPPYIAYKETVTRRAEGNGRYVRQVAGSGQYAHVRLRLSPRQRGEGRRFLDETVGGSIPRQFIASVEEGVNHALNDGVCAGYMRVEITVPPASVSTVFNDLLNRRAHIRQRSDDGIEADAPLAELLGYASWLRENTRGAGRVTMELDRYQILKPGDGPEDGGAGVGVPRAPFPPPLRASAASLDS